MQRFLDTIVKLISTVPILAKVTVRKTIYASQGKPYKQQKIPGTTGREFNIDTHNYSTNNRVLHSSNYHAIYAKDSL